MENLQIIESSPKICAGIVLYNPDIEKLSENISAIISQVKTVVLVDNGSTNIGEVQDRWENIRNIVFIKNEKNQGIAKALNQMCEWAMNNDFNWILTLDQDSVCDINMVRFLRRNVQTDDIGIVCPKVVFRIGQETVQQIDTMVNDKDGTLEACITSGSLTRISAWDKVGGFDDWMFIDHVDNDFCMRLRLNDYRIIRSNDAILYQNAGEMAHRKSLIGKTKMIANYSPLRNYYIVRNSVYYMRKYRRQVSLIREIGRLGYIEVEKLLHEAGKIKTIRSGMAGLKDGVLVKINKSF